MDKDQIKVDKELCIGCGSCVAVAPNSFILDENYKVGLADNIADDDSAIESAVSICPVQAIKIVK